MLRFLAPAALVAALAGPARARGVPAPTPEELRTLPGPLLVERGLRLQPLQEEEGRYLVVLGTLRARWEAMQCRDPTAPQALLVAMLMIRDSGANPPTDKPASSAPYVRRALAEDAVFSGAASPWWACSHGLDALAAGAAGKPLAESDWRLAEPERLKLRQDLAGLYTTIANGR